MRASIFIKANMREQCEGRPIPQRSAQLYFNNPIKMFAKRASLLYVCRCVVLYKRPRDQRKLFIKSCTKTTHHYYMMKFECGQGATNQLWSSKSPHHHVVLYLQHLLMPSTRNRLWNWMQYNAVKEDRARALFIFPMQTHKAYFHVSFSEQTKCTRSFFFLKPT